MELNINERISLLGILSPIGNVVTLRIVRDLQTKLGFTEKDMKLYKMKNRVMSDGGVSVTWDQDFSSVKKEVEIGEVARGLIVDQLKKLDSESKLHINMLPLYEKFVEAKVEAK